MAILWGFDQEGFFWRSCKNMGVGRDVNEDYTKELDIVYA
jgi:hypothetical protein